MVDGKPPFGVSGRRAVPLSLLTLPLAIAACTPPVFESIQPQAAAMFPPSSVRIESGSPFGEALEVNRRYLLAHDPHRLLAPFRREAGLEPKASSYGNWESLGLDGHTAGHYLSALSFMVASGNDTPDGELERRLDAMLEELAVCQSAHGDGYLGGVPGGRELWLQVRAGRIDAQGFGLNGKWVPWYNLHKTFAGLRDAWLVGGREAARTILLGLGEWALDLLETLDDVQVQQMLIAEHGGMNEVMADLYATSGDVRYLGAARRFNHQEILGPLMRQEDRLTGLHANTQIPKVVGLQRIAALTGDLQAAAGARFFWDNVVDGRSVVFGGNSVSEHFNPRDDFRGLLEHREGPETCNTYNMLRLTAQLFCETPDAGYADWYERALYNHILASIHPSTPGYVYFTPIRPRHYRVYSQPETAFWCCVGTGMENPGRYGSFIYSRARDGIYVNLFIPSELRVEPGWTLNQTTRFPDEPATRLTVSLDRPLTFTLYLRHPAWVDSDSLRIRINGVPLDRDSVPSSWVQVRRLWRDGDIVEMDLPMRTTVERLPDGSDWAALLHGPIVLAAPAGTEDLVGLLADDSRMGQVAQGPVVPLEQIPGIRVSEADLPAHVVPDPEAGPLRFRLAGVFDPLVPEGITLLPFFRLHGERYQMYWQLNPVRQPR